jgi:hypothetical protein
LVESSVPDPGSRAFLTLDPELVKNQDPDPGLTSQIIFSRAWKQFFGSKILKFFDADPRSGVFLTLDLGTGMGSGIRDKHPGTATLLGMVN